MADALVLHPADTVAVAVGDLKEGETVTLGGNPAEDALPITLAQDIKAGHKFALHPMKNGDEVIKYSASIGHLTQPVRAGQWIHSHNLETNLGPDLVYDFNPLPGVKGPGKSKRTFWGFPRKNGDVGIRNDLYIVPTVGCINGLCDNVARQFELSHIADNPFDSIIITRHPYGCSQLGGDLEATKQILQDIVTHPNAGGVLVIGLGCENLQMESLNAGLGAYDPQRVKFLIAQQTIDEYADASNLLEEIAYHARSDKRKKFPVSRLRVGMKCGGSDGFSGITANALIGRFADYLIDQGGSVVLTEVPEMFGAEQFLMGRAKDKATFGRIVSLINDFKEYFRRYDQPIYENPSPGNKEGGITTLEEKSLGCIQKSGTTQVRDVLDYGQKIRENGLSLLQGPGNDLVSTSALAASGCQLVLFSTGRGTPFGTYVPTIKVASNTRIATHKKQWIDFDAGRLLNEDSQSVLNDFVELILQVVNGKPTRNEENHMQEIAIFKDGVTE